MTLSAEARRRIRGWYFFDWASQPFSTLVLTFVFSPFFVVVVGDGVRAQELWGWALALSGVTIALLAPVLGAIADTRGRRMPWIVLFSAFYVVGSWALWLAVPDAPPETVLLVLLAFGVGMIGMEFATVFTNALLPDLVPEDQTGRVSGTGFAFGYWGGVVALAIMLALFVEQENGRTLAGLAPVLGLDAAAREGTRAVGPVTALWYLLFMVPFFLWVREVRRPAMPGGIGRALGDLGRSIAGLRVRASLAAYLGSSMVYRDALNGVYGFGGIYAVGVLGWTITQVGVFGVVGAISAAVFAWVGGRFDARRGPKPVILFCGGVLIVVCTIIVGMSRSAFFGVPLAEGSAIPDVVMYLCGAAIGGAGGALQAASRTMMVLHADPARPAEAFGLYALSGKAMSFVSPALVAAATAWSGSQQAGIVPIILMLALGLAWFARVNPRGERA